MRAYLLELGSNALPNYSPITSGSRREETRPPRGLMETVAGRILQRWRLVRLNLLKCDGGASTAPPPPAEMMHCWGGDVRTPLRPEERRLGETGGGEGVRLVEEEMVQ